MVSLHQLELLKDSVNLIKHRISDYTHIAYLCHNTKTLHITEIPCQKSKCTNHYWESVVTLIPLKVNAQIIGLKNNFSTST